MGQPWSQQWFDESTKWRGRILQGRYAHWCADWDELPVDETTPNEFVCCHCFRCQCGALMIPKEYPWFGRRPFEILEDVWLCPNRKWYNFWKHRWYDRGPYNE